MKNNHNLGILLAFFLGVSLLLGVSVVKAVVTPTSCSTDLNSDGTTNLLDYSLLRQAFAPLTQTTNPADVNQDGYVNLLDYSWFRLFFFVPCTVAPTPTPTPLPSPTPSPDLSFVISPNTRTDISPYIFGTNNFNYSRSKLVRAGGNRWTGYNWENNASNAGTDWQNSSDNYLCEAASDYACLNSAAPGQAVRGRVERAHGGQAAALVTLPMLDYVAADKAGSVPTAANPSNTRWAALGATKPAAEASVMGDRQVYQSEFIDFMASTFPGAQTGATPPVFFSLDNEPGLWTSTHPLLQPSPTTYSQVMERTLRSAQVIKDSLPAAQVFGAVAYGYGEFQNLQAAADAGTARAPGQVGSTYLDYYLAAVKAGSAAAGRRLVDVLDIHWYPEARDPAVGCRITNCSSVSDTVVQARIQAPRSLWDPSYVEQSWIAQDVLGNSAIRLLPDLKTRINNNYPGTKLAISEYNYGGGNHISGAIAQADVLGIFAKEGVFAANLWELDGNNAYFYGAFDMYLNFDGAGAQVGSQLLAATTSNVVDSSVYAMANPGDQTVVYVVAINKTSSSQPTAISLTSSTNYRTGQVYQLTAASAVPSAASPLTFTNNTAVYTMPAYSVSTIVIRN